MLKKALTYLQDHKVVFIAICMVLSLILSNVLNFVVAKVTESDTEEVSTVEESDDEDSEDENSEEQSEDEEETEGTVLTDSQQAVAERYTTDISTLISALATEYWVSDGLKYTLELTEDGTISFGTDNGSVEDTFAVVSASVSPQVISNSTGSATETDLVVLLSDDSYEVIRVYTYAVYDEDDDGAFAQYEYLVLYSDLFDGTTFSNAYSHIDFSVSGLDDERLLAVIGDEAAASIESGLKTLVEDSYPTFTSAAWSEYIIIDYAEGTAQLTFIITSESVELTAEADDAGDTVTAVYSSFEESVATAVVDLETNAVTIS